MHKTIYTEVEVDVDLADFNTDDLVQELESRGWIDTDNTSITNSTEILRSIHQKRRTGQDYQNELDQLIWCGLGKIV
jgi:hypothetical protein